MNATTPIVSTSTGLPISSDQFNAAPLHIPDGKGGAYKTELVIRRTPDITEKINWWHGPDPRKEPHSHPWPFKSTILRGGLSMRVYHLEFDAYCDSGILGSNRVKIAKVTQVEFNEGATYEMSANVFHTVDKVKPGTVTHMLCGAFARANGEWGHILHENGLDWYEPVTKATPEFLMQLHALNPHLVKR